METLEHRFVDKRGWVRGPWDCEPDKVQWQDAETGLPCIAVRNSSLGNWCGYVGVEEGHPYYGNSDEDTLELECHGGVTFTGFCDGDEEKGICHTPAAGEPDRVFWIGFDCAHCYDFSPGLDATIRSTGGESWRENVYRDLAYVQKECADLARQLRAVSGLAANVERAARSML
jgi:hypothetical protein